MNVKTVFFTCCYSWKTAKHQQTRSSKDSSTPLVVNIFFGLWSHLNEQHYVISRNPVWIIHLWSIPPGRCCRRQWIQNFQCDLGVKSITISLSVRLCNLCQLLNNRKILKNWEIPLSCLFRIRWRKREELGRQAVGQNTTGMEKVWTSAQFTTTDHHWSLSKQREAWWCCGYLKMFTHACTLGLRKFQKRVQVYFLAYG